MNIPQSIIANEMYQQNFWWSFSPSEGRELLTVSKKMQKLLGRKIETLEDFAGESETTLIRFKMNKALELSKKKQALDIRFVSILETIKGQKSFQNQLQVIDVEGVDVIWSTCLDISEMAALEKEIVDAHGRSSLAQIKQRQELLEEQNKFISDSYDQQSRFLALLSHELRSPLLGISSLVKRLREDVDGSDQALNMLKTINMTAEQANYLVNDILTYSQTEYDGITLHPSKVLLPELLENVKQLTKSIAADKSLIVSLVYLSNHDEVRVDGVRLTQILINLIVNSIKFTQFGGVNIEVAEKQPGLFSFKITDSGEGINNELLESIFEPFAQLKPDSEYTSSRSLGAGLGLFVVKQLVELMGSKINVSSTMGVGTTFEFSLQLECTQTDKKNHKTAKASNRTTKQTAELDGNLSKNHQSPHKHNDLDSVAVTKGYRVLVADDSKINRMVLAGYLADLSCEVIEAVDGRQAWELFQQNDFDYVLLDIQMPYMDGVEVSQKIQSLRTSNKLESLKGVFAITAGGESSGFKELKDEPKSYGFDEWLVKPVSKEQIMRLFTKNYRAQEMEGSSAVSSGDSNSANHHSQSESTEPFLYENRSTIPKQFAHLIEPFLEEMQSSLEKLNYSNQAQDRQAIQKLAHYLKGNCMLFQLRDLANQFTTLENVQEPTKNDVQRELETVDILDKIRLAVKFLEN